MTNAAEQPISALPETAQELVRLIGYAMTIELIRHFGGQRIRFPKSDDTASFEAVAEIVGPQLASKLGEEFYLEEKYIPLCFKAMKKVERQQIVSRFDELSKAGKGSREVANQLAREFGKSYRTIELIANCPAA